MSIGVDIGNIDMQKIGVLTGIDANHGSCIFNSSLYRLIKDLNPEYDLKFIDIPKSRYKFHELLRALKPNPKIPFYNLQRSITLSRFTRSEIPIEQLTSLEKYDRLVNELILKQYPNLIVAKVVWDISNDSVYRFPNINWLSEKIRCNKIAYAVSGHRTDMELFKRHKKKVYELLSSFQLIGVRDRMTQVMMEEAGVDKTVPVHRISDPAFLYEPKQIEPATLLKLYKIATDRPILGLLCYGKADVSQKIRQYYHQKGYQIVNFSMYNPFADINIGHRVTPDEWVALFKQLSFCITDRFHGSVFCLRENIPFAGIEPYAPRTLLNSKIYSLLQDFNIEASCYFNTYLPGFKSGDFLSACEHIETTWQKELSGTVHSRLQVQNNNQLAFLGLVNQYIKLSYP